MSDKQSCGNCYCYRPEPLQKNAGTCRMNERQGQLVPSAGGGLGVVGWFPSTDRDLWCAKWKAAEVSQAPQTTNLPESALITGAIR